MRKEVKIEVTETPITLISGITFAQTPYWFPMYGYKDLKMDLLVPFRRPQQGEQRPLIIWICGGAFQTMERSAHIPWLINFAKHGFVAASIEYRLSNSSTMSGRLGDVKAAIRYLRAHAEMYGIDPERIIIGGESAGGMLASLAGATCGEMKYEVGAYLEERSQVSAVIDFYGPYTVMKKTKQDSADWDIDEIDLTKMPPVFLAHGTKDEILELSYSEEYDRLLEQNGVETTFYVVEGAGHMGMEFYQKEMFDKIMMFLQKSRMC